MPFTRWEAVSAFQPHDYLATRRVFYSFSDRDSGNRFIRRLNRTVYGYEAMLPSNYGLWPEELARTLNAWRSHRQAEVGTRSDSTYVLSGFATKDSYEARVPDWEPERSFTSTDLAETAARGWLSTGGSEAQVEIIQLSDGEGQVVEIVTQAGVEPIL